MKVALTELITIGAILAFAATVLGEQQGIRISPDKNGTFQYTDDFSTPKFLGDTVAQTVTAEFWQKGAVTSAGPERMRVLTYRFYGDRSISAFNVLVHQRACKNLGGINWLALSSNGLDWTRVADTSSQEQDHNSWRSDPLTVPAEEVKKPK